MSDDSEIATLYAESMACQAILTCVLQRLIKNDVGLRLAVADGFDDAANIIEQLAIKLGKGADPRQTIEALRVVEELRANVLGDQSKPKHTV